LITKIGSTSIKQTVAAADALLLENILPHALPAGQGKNEELACFHTVYGKLGDAV
jgi:hypothetical protein